MNGVKICVLRCFNFPLGNELPVHQKVNKKLFAGGHVLVNNTLKILKPLFVSETYLWDYQGNIPCVVLNFNKITGNFWLFIYCRLQCISKVKISSTYIYITVLGIKNPY